MTSLQINLKCPQMQLRINKIMSPQCSAIWAELAKWSKQSSKVIRPNDIWFRLGRNLNLRSRSLFLPRNSPLAHIKRFNVIGLNINDIQNIVITQRIPNYKNPLWERFVPLLCDVMGTF